MGDRRARPAACGETGGEDEGDGAPHRAPILVGIARITSVACGLLVLVLGVAACGGSGHSERATLPSCVHPKGAVDGELPPLPPGSVLDRHRREFGRNVVEGYIPGELEQARDFIQRELPKQGYRLGEGDAEEHEAETDFSGNHIEDGHLRLRDIPGCEGAVAVAITY